MSDPIIKVEGLGKRYFIAHDGRGAGQGRYRYERFSDVLLNAAKSPFRRLHALGSALRSAHSTTKNQEPGTKNQAPSTKNALGPTEEELWALKDVSFEVRRGEVIGIIGRNGAGKSTLLKILSRITEPTTGQVEIDGRVASLLEVGTGFHPELTGRENIFLNGAILGMTRAEIKKKFDEIVAFAETEKFLDTPVKHYSSGMYVRLAFAIAAHLEPEILLVDEVLAVGDAQFQKKCLGKMGEVSRGGRTVLFVSHNMAAVKSLCKRAVLLRDGVLNLDGSSDRVVGEYLAGNGNSKLVLVWPEPKTPQGGHQVWLRRLAVEAEPRDPHLDITIASAIRIVAEYWNDVGGALLNLSLVLYTADDICVLNTWSKSERLPRGFVRSVCHIPAHFLNDERYRVRLLIVRDNSVALTDQDSLLWFEVNESTREGNWFGKVIGTVRPQLVWDTTPLTEGV
jgi:lipopolysaccharide transport system ATP-binding protein